MQGSAHEKRPRTSHCGTARTQETQLRKLKGVSDIDDTDELDDACPFCESDEVIQVVDCHPEQISLFGDSDWKYAGRSPELNPDRECGSCGEVWNSHTDEAPPTVRLLSDAGASFALLPAPSLVDVGHPDTHVVDIELLSPDRLVRYLGRRLSSESLQRLAAAWLQAAHDLYPEQTVATVQDDAAGLAVVVIESTPFAVTLEVIIETALDDDVPDHDGVSFDVARSMLIDAAHRLEEWLA